MIKISCHFVLLCYIDRDYEFLNKRSGNMKLRDSKNCIRNYIFLNDQNLQIQSNVNLVLNIDFVNNYLLVLIK